MSLASYRAAPPRVSFRRRRCRRPMRFNIIPRRPWASRAGRATSAKRELPSAARLSRMPISPPRRRRKPHANVVPRKRAIICRNWLLGRDFSFGAPARGWYTRTGDFAADNRGRQAQPNTGRRAIIDYPPRDSVAVACRERPASVKIRALRTHGAIFARSPRPLLARSGDRPVRSWPGEFRGAAAGSPRRRITADTRAGPP